jgi:NADH-quinone oxidoreductase subunit N
MRANPLLGFALALGLFSIAGVPPLAGFFAKMSLFTAAVNAGLTPLAVIGLLSSCVSAFYYLRVIKLCYFETSAWVPLRPLTAGRGWILGGCLLILVIFGAYPTPLLHFATSMAASLPL